MLSEEKSVSEKIYQLKIYLFGVSPMVWRRLLVSDQTSTAHFHMMIKIAMGWENLHLHEFIIIAIFKENLSYNVAVGIANMELAIVI
ncbi:MAG: hypothetical protein AAGD28_18785 [Bacteroidota bacterium]